MLKYKSSQVEVRGQELKGKGIGAVPAVGPVDVLGLDEELLPMGGISKTINVGSNESGRWMTYPSDRYGFNNPDSEWDSGLDS